MRFPWSKPELKTVYAIWDPLCGIVCCVASNELSGMKACATLDQQDNRGARYKHTLKPFNLDEVK